MSVVKARIKHKKITESVKEKGLKVYKFTVRTKQKKNIVFVIPF